jgi:hypothetical protein
LLRLLGGKGLLPGGARLCLLLPSSLGGGALLLHLLLAGPLAGRRVRPGR